MIERLMWCAAIVLMLAAAWPRSARPVGGVPAAWRPPPPPRLHCGAAVEVVGVLPDPARERDRDGETVWLRNLEPEPLELSGWQLASGSRTLSLGEVVLAPGELRALVGRELAPLRLANRAGEVHIRDPCALERGLAWERSIPGWAELAEPEYPPPPCDPSVPCD